MKSPANPQISLVKTELEPGLTVFHCPESNGHYLPAECYWRWLAKHPERLAKFPPSGENLPPEEAPSTRICPESGLPMLRYKVGHGFSFTIDRSPTGAIWLDAGEWNALRDHHFHDELHLIFTLPWQRRVRQEGTTQALSENLRNRIGEESLTKVSDFKAWLQAQDEQSAILAFLRDSS